MNTQSNVDVTKLTIEQLESLAWREFEKFESAKNNLLVLRTEINKRRESEGEKNEKG